IAGVSAAGLPFRPGNGEDRAMCNQNSASVSRRSFFAAGAALAGTVAASGLLTRAARAQQAPSSPRMLFKGGTVLTMDRALGDLASGDMLVENGRIAAVGPNLTAAGAQVIDCANM